MDNPFQKNKTELLKQSRFSIRRQTFISGKQESLKEPAPMPDSQLEIRQFLDHFGRLNEVGKEEQPSLQRLSFQEELLALNDHNFS